MSEQPIPMGRCGGLEKESEGGEVEMDRWLGRSGFVPDFKRH